MRPAKMGDVRFELVTAGLPRMSLGRWDSIEPAMRKMRHFTHTYMAIQRLDFYGAELPRRTNVADNREWYKGP